MPAPYTQIYLMPNGAEITSVALDLPEFDWMAEQLRGTMSAGGQRVTDAQVEAIKAARHLPLMKRGTLTQQFFDRWGVGTDLMSVIVRGAGREILQQLVGGRDVDAPA